MIEFCSSTNKLLSQLFTTVDTSVAMISVVVVAAAADVDDVEVSSLPLDFVSVSLGSNL